MEQNESLEIDHPTMAQALRSILPVRGCLEALGRVLAPFGVSCVRLAATGRQKALGPRLSGAGNRLRGELLGRKASAELSVGLLRDDPRMHVLSGHLESSRGRTPCL